jgi:hypothetical protein
LVSDVPSQHLHAPTNMSINRPPELHLQEIHPHTRHHCTDPYRYTGCQERRPHSPPVIHVAIRKKLESRCIPGIQRHGRIHRLPVAHYTEYEETYVKYADTVELQYVFGAQRIEGQCGLPYVT